MSALNDLKLNPNLLNVPLYVAGKPIEEVQEEYGLTQVVKLASNENPLGLSPLALAAFHAALQDAHRYPAIGDRNLRRKLAAMYNTEYDAAFNQDNFMTGNGIGDILRMIAESFIFDGGEYEELLKRGVIVRVPAGFGLPDALRVTIGTHPENETPLSALKDVFRNGHKEPHA